jgi:hypothetical protein
LRNVFDIGNGSRIVMFMEFIKGGDLATLLKARAKKELEIMNEQSMES